VTLLNLTPTSEAKPGQAAAPLDLTALLTAGVVGANTGVTFVNSGKETLYVQMGTAVSTIVVTIGSTVEGQGVSSITYSGLVASHIYEIGPFNSDFDGAASVVTVTFGTPANVAGVALVSNAGAA
jgi:hypothetical protein